MADKDEKAARLAAALRENLRKRKAQARGTASQPPAPPEDEPLALILRYSWNLYDFCYFCLTQLRQKATFYPTVLCRALTGCLLETATLA